MENVLTKYAELMLTKRELEVQLEELKPIVIQKMEKEREPVAGLGELIISEKKTYTYSNEVQQEEIALKAKKKFEEREGIAAYVSSPVLKFLAKNDESGDL